MANKKQEVRSAYRTERAMCVGLLRLSVVHMWHCWAGSSIVSRVMRTVHATFGVVNCRRVSRRIAVTTALSSLRDAV